MIKTCTWLLSLQIRAIQQKYWVAALRFTINTEDKKKDKDAFVIHFPVINRTNMRSQFRQRGGAPGAPGGGAPQPPDSAAIADMRKAALAAIKEINIKGFKDIPDSVISIYNEYGIKAAVGYDGNGSFIYELAVPLAQLGLTVDKPKEFAYNLKVNGIQMGQRRDDNNGPRPGGDGGGQGGGFGGDQGGGGNRGGGGGGGNFGGAGGGGNRGGGGDRVRIGGFGGGGFNMQDMMSPTDFLGQIYPGQKTIITNSILFNPYYTLPA
jgi:hypothetical protein